jgi:hypothetical protein
MIIIPTLFHTHCDLEIWNLQYNALLEVKFMERTKVATRGASVRAVENYVNAELSKITLWAKNNKTKFN